MNRHLRPAIEVAFAAAALVALLFVPGGPTAPARQTAELHALISDGMKPVVEELTPQIERATGRKLAAEFNSSKNLRDKIQAGESFDVAIITSDVLDDLAKQGKIAAGSKTELSRTGMGVGVRAGAPKPDVSTPEALKRTLLNAKSIAFNPTGASAAPTYKIFERLGIMHAVRPKLVLDADAGRPQQNVVAGKVELVISLIPEIKFFPGVDLVGPMPAELQSYVNFAGGVAANTHEAEAAKSLIRFLAGPDTALVLKAKGMEAAR